MREDKNKDKKEDWRTKESDKKLKEVIKESWIKYNKIILRYNFKWLKKCSKENKDKSNTNKDNKILKNNKSKKEIKCFNH